MSINLIVNCTDMKRIMVGFILKGQELSLHMNVHEQSIYSLEELFRHEFTHYLQGRYEVQGLWGQGKCIKMNV